VLCGIISDIHGNLEALTVVLDELKSVERIICLGDVVGYGANPNECCEVIRSKISSIIVGNHDLAAVGNYDLNDFNPYAREAILWTQKQLTPENKEFLQSLKERLILEVPPGHLTLVHDSLVGPGDYITSCWEARESLSLQDTQVCFIGHTHIAEYYQMEEGSSFCQQIPLWSGGAIEVREGYRYIINCGSVGQPRDRNPQASFGIYDSKKKSIEVKRVDYPVEVAQEKIERAGLPRILSQRLGIGW